jgi:Icc-related predicted phosphoesterase
MEKAMTEAKETVRLAAVGDIHVTKSSQGAMQQLFAQANEAADVLVLCGDLTDYGLPEEAHVLAREIATALKVPCVAVLGNHDFESGKQTEVRDILCDAGVHMLDGEAVEIAGIGFAGVKGFAGGFGRATLGAWGEDAIKGFVQEAINEELKLEAALARLRTAQRVAVLHYSPVRQTCEGEPTEIFPFLGSGRLEEPINRYRARAVFHGHAHSGAPEGATARGIPVYNVAMPLLRRHFPNQPPFRLLELPTAGEPAQTAAQTQTAAAS